MNYGKIVLGQGVEGGGHGRELLVGAGVSAQCPASQVIPGKVAKLPALSDYAQLCRFLSRRMTPREQRVPVPHSMAAVERAKGPRGHKGRKNKHFMAPDEDSTCEHCLRAS